MRSLISNLRMLLLPHVNGYVYVPHADQGPMRHARAGLTIRNPDDNPPWIIVHHSLPSATAATEPGTLWKVEILRKAPEQPEAEADYTNAIAVQVLEEVPLSRLS